MAEGKVFQVSFSYTEGGLTQVLAPSEDVAVAIVEKRLNEVGVEFGFDFKVKHREVEADCIEALDINTFALPKVVSSEKSKYATKYLIEKDGDEYELASMERLIEYGTNLVESNLSDSSMLKHLIAKYNEKSMEAQDAMIAIEWFGESVTPIHSKKRG